MHPSHIVYFYASIHQYIGMFWWIMLPMGGALALTLSSVALLSHLAATYSAMGKVIMSTNAMSHEKILSLEEAEQMDPSELHDMLMDVATLAEQAKVPIHRQYRISFREYIHSHAGTYLQPQVTSEKDHCH
jgi:hypothetical protein